MGLLLGIFGVSFAIGFSGAVLPGPVTVLVVADVRKWGFRAGLLVALGHAALEAAMVGALVAGLAVLIRGLSGAPILTLLAQLIALGGGALLVWMGVGMLRVPGPDPVREWKSGRSGPFLDGIWGSLANPYWTLWWVVIGAAFLLYSISRAGYAGAAAFYAGHILSDMVWFSVVSAGVAAVSSRRGERKLGRGWLLKICGALLLAFGAAFLVIALAAPRRLVPKMPKETQSEFLGAGAEAPRPEDPEADR